MQILDLNSPMRAIAVALVTATVVRGAERDVPALRVRLASIERGNRISSFGDDAARFQNTPMATAATKAGVDVRRPDHPMLAHSYRDGRLFYLFYNDLENVPPNRFLIQRIKRVKTTGDGDGYESTSIDYQVEAIKSLDGNLKKPDQHFGSYTLQGAIRRTIEKECEIGIGRIEGVAVEGLFPPGKLFHILQSYQPRPGKFDQVQFDASARWKVSATFDQDGNYELRCPELGIEVVRRLLAPE